MIGEALTTTLLFPFVDYWWFYAGFSGFVLAMLLLDLGVFHKEAHIVSVKESAAWSAVWFSLALIFNVGFYYYALTTFPTDVRQCHTRL